MRWMLCITSEIDAVIKREMRKSGARASDCVSIFVYIRTNWLVYSAVGKRSVMDTSVANHSVIVQYLHWIGERLSRCLRAWRVYLRKNESGMSVLPIYLIRRQIFQCIVIAPWFRKGRWIESNLTVVPRLMVPLS